MFKRRTLALVAISACLSVPALSQTTIYDMTFTGAELATALGVVFPTRTPTVSVPSLVFGPGVASLEILMRLPLVPAGTVAASTPVAAIYDITVAPLTADNDLYWLLGDGSLLPGGEHADNTGGTGLALAWGDPPVSLLEAVILFTGAGNPPVGTSHDVTVKICISDLKTTVNTAFGTGDGSADLTTTLDETQALELVLVAHDPPEEYRIDMLRVRLLEDSPGMGQSCSDTPVELIHFEIE